MKQYILLSILFTFSLFTSWANGLDSSIIVHRQSGITINGSRDMFRSVEDTSKYKAFADSVVSKVEQMDKWLESIQPDDLNELPIGLKTTISNVSYKIAISSAIFYETYAELTVFAKVEIPQNPKELFFGVSGLKFSYKGGIIGDARLVLLGDVPININGGNSQVILKGGFNKKNGQALDDLTFITMDCNGFKEMGLAADVVFPRSLLLPCSSNGDVIQDASQKVKGSFKTVISDWNDILVGITLPKFQVNGLDGFVFTVTNAVFDFSDTRNSSTVQFPTGYELRHMNYPTPNMWRGVFVQNIDVMLPKAFKRKGNDRISFGANNLIIDNNGVSGSFYGRNIIPFKDGSASGWRLSVDELKLGIEANHLVEAGFKGNIGLPVADKDSLTYEAVITQDNKYWLTVSPKGKIDFQFLQAKCELDSNSYIKLLVEDNQFLPEANLYGRLTINASSKGDESKSIASFKGVTFRGLRLRTRSPYFSVDYFGYDGEVKIANFPVSIDSIVLVANNTHADLSFGLNVTLQDKAFKAKTRLTIGADFETAEGVHRWKLGKVGLESVRIDNAKIGELTLNGEVRFFDDDPTYGNGFGGGVNATFASLNIEVQVRAIFGHTKEFRYWFVDGLAQWSPGITIVGPVMLNGFAGGAYYHMSKMNAFAGISKNLMPEYKPDKALGLGIKAGVLFCVGDPQVVNARAEFEVAFNNNGGINYIGFFGNADIMKGLTDELGDELEQAKKVFAGVSAKDAEATENMSDEQKEAKVAEAQQQKVEDPQKAAAQIPCSIGGPNFKGLSAYLGMFYDFKNKIFKSNFELYLNVANVLTGVGENYCAGWAEMYFSPGDWHVYMGTPNKPIGIQFGLGGFNLKTESYFMMGTKIPGSPPPPSEVADILGVNMRELDYMRDLNALGDGRGFATGARLSVQTGDLTFLILYANFKAGLGFDIMLKQYKGAHCEGSLDPIGINGWYGNAQAYVFLQGELGVKVNLKFIKFRFPIIQGAAAALLQAKLPNPSWFQGYLGVKFSILGGLVKGNMNFKLKIGNECKIVSGDGKEAVVGMAVISDITPKDTINTDVFTAPQAAFNFAIDKDIPIQDETGPKTFRVQLDQFDLVANGKTIPGKIQWNSNRDVATFYSTEVLPSNANVKTTVRVSFKELKNGSWQTVYTDGQKSEESKVLSFVTGKAPESIPLTNIDYSWPVVEQKNFYRGETAEGYVQLKRGQTYLFNIPGYRQELFFVPASGGQPIAVPFQYDSVKCRLSYNVNKLEGDMAYQLLLNSTPSTQKIATATPQPNTIADENGLEMTNNQATDIARTDIAKTILEYSFQSSHFNTFKARMEHATLTATKSKRVSSDVVNFMQGVNNAGVFDMAELTGTAYTAGQPLVQPVAEINNEFYFSNDIQPLIYAGVPYGDINITQRDTTEWGAIPLKALPVSLVYKYQIEQENYSDPQVTVWLPYIYDLPAAYKADFQDLQDQVVNRYLGTPQQKDYEKLINGYYPFIREGYYNVNYQYVLPGGIKGSSSVVPYHNTIK